jgi:hypothetical protein
MTALYFTQIAESAYVVSRATMNPLLQGASNHEYARPIDEGASLLYAPSLIAPNLREPTETEYNTNGYYHVEIQSPNPPEGEDVSSTTYIITNNHVEAVYTYEPTNTVQTTKSFLLDLGKKDLLSEYRIKRRDIIRNRKNGISDF